MKLSATKKLKMRYSALSLTVLLFFLFSFLTLVDDAHGQAMTSSHYKMQSDSVNFGGGRSSSGSYAIEDTAGEIATGISSSAHYIMGAGYQQMQVVYLSVTSAASVVMSPALGGLSGGTSNGSTSFIVTTDDPAGYAATIQASSSPALKSATDSFADYVPAGTAPDYAFNNAATASSFSFSPEGVDIDGRYENNASNVCGTGSLDTADACWDGLSTSPRTILARTSDNTPNGTITTLKFRAASGTSHIQTNGTYMATTTVTVIAL
jgi:hypothetical protein